MSDVHFDQVTGWWYKVDDDGNIVYLYKANEPSDEPLYEGNDDDEI